MITAIGNRSQQQIFATAVGRPAARAFSAPAISRVGVIGLGLMGHGIAQVAAEKGFQVVAVESENRFLDSGMKRIETSVQKLGAKAVKKGTMSESEAKAHFDATLGRVSPSLNRADLADCDLVIEAVIEDLALKKPLYEEIGATVSDRCIIASNTSSLSIAKMAEFCGRPKQMLGLHFFNPVQLMQLVEVVRTEQTDAALFESAFGFASALGKKPIRCVDTEGFVVNRLLVPYLIEAIALVERGVASPSDVDLAMKLGAGHPMGPIQLADYIGLDTVRNIISGWEGFQVPETLEAKVVEGKLGRKSGEGFYRWDGDKLAE
uniref:3-hydroxyacyl-CoA dehydrogenase n=1 Tax=Chrysotila carterae TaxID=13221 RepID=A0A7S4EWU4_CHRCT